MISLCVPFYPWYRQYERTEEMFDIMLTSLNQVDGVEELELCVADGGSEDVFGMGRYHNFAEFEDRIRSNFKGVLQYTHESHISERSKKRRWWLAKSVELAVELSTQDNLFLVGMDLWFLSTFITDYEKYVSDGRVWVLRVGGVKTPDDIVKFVNGEIRQCWNMARGIVGITKNDYYKLGGYDTNYIKDSSDSNFFDRMVAEGLQIRERREMGYFHVNHPGSHFIARYEE